MSNEPPTQKVDLTPQERLNLSSLLPQRGQTTDQSRAIRNLRKRLELEESISVQRLCDGMVQATGDHEDTTVFELTDGEVSLIQRGIDQLEEEDSVPTSEPFFEVLDKVEPLINTTKNRHSEDDE